MTFYPNSGKYSVRAFIVPRVRVTLGRFRSRSEAEQAYHAFNKTKVLPTSCTLRFKNVHQEPTGTWAYELHAGVFGGFRTMLEAVRARRREHDNVRQRSRRAQTVPPNCLELEEERGSARKKPNGRVLRGALRTAAEEEAKKKAASEKESAKKAAAKDANEEQVLVDFSSCWSAAPWLCPY